MGVRYHERLWIRVDLIMTRRDQFYAYHATIKRFLVSIASHRLVPEWSDAAGGDVVTAEGKEEFAHNSLWRPGQ